MNWAGPLRVSEWSGRQGTCKFCLFSNSGKVSGRELGGFCVALFSKVEAQSVMNGAET